MEPENMLVFKRKLFFLPFSGSMLIFGVFFMQKIWPFPSSRPANESQFPRSPSCFFRFFCEGLRFASTRHDWWGLEWCNMGASKNRGGPPKSSMFVGFSIINHPFWGTPIFANTYMRTEQHPGCLNTWIFRICVQNLRLISPQKPTQRQKFYISGRSRYIQSLFLVPLTGGR